MYSIYVRSKSSMQCRSLRSAALYCGGLAGGEHGGAWQVPPIPQAADDGRDRVLGGQLLECQPKAHTIDLGHVGCHALHLGLQQIFGWSRWASYIEDTLLEILCQILSYMAGADVSKT